MAKFQTNFWFGVALIVFPAFHLLYLLVLSNSAANAARPLIISMDVILIGVGIFLLWLNKRNGGV